MSATTGGTAFDRTTGRRVWHLASWNVYRPLDGGSALVYNGTGVEEGFLGALIDPRDGRVIEVLSPWQPTGATYGRWVLLWRRMRAGGVLFAVRDAGTGTLVVVGRASDWYTAPSCQLTGTHVACVGRHRLAIWRWHRN